jgi:hypothetical protein
MSRFRTRWLDDGDDARPDPLEVPDRRFSMAREPSTARRIPLANLQSTRGRWLKDEPVGPPADVDPDLDVDAEARPTQGIVPTPKWCGSASALAGLLFSLLAVIAITGDTNVAKALIVAPVLGFIVYTIAQRIAASTGQPAVVPILMGGLAIKLAGVLARYWIGLQVYGRSDATEYDQWGKAIAPGLRHFHLINIGKLQGTNFLRLVTGVVYAITPASPMVGFFVFGFMAYIGTIMFWLAFKRAFPNIPDLRYLQVLVLMPSLAFWPSAIGKDAWMVMGVGIASYGVANILTNRSVLGWAVFVVGVYAVLMVRPPVGIALMAGLLIAELFRARGSQGAGRAALSVLLLVVVGGVVMSSAKGFLGIDKWSKASIDQELGSVADRTGEGRSEFTPTQVNSPVQFPIAGFTVLFRPMPYETHSPQEMLSAFENLALLGVFGYSMPKLWVSLRRARRRPYLLYCIGVISVFIVEFSTFSNFAIIARERTQITALLLVFLCLPRDEPVEIATPTVRSQGAVAPRPSPA